MAPQRRLSHLYYQTSHDARQAAVMALLVPKEEWHILLIKRPAHPKDPHSGQISFPGGRREEEDTSFEECALRETYEEIGIPQQDIKILGPLTKLYIYASNNIVYPYVGYVEQVPTLKLQESEVDHVISVPLSYFKNTEIIKSRTLQVRNFTLTDVPYYDLHGEVLWGATAMMISELVSIW